MILLALFQLATADTTATIRDITTGPGETIRTTTIGQGNESVVFIAAIFGGAFGYRHLTAPISALGFRCIVVEPLGFGFSSHPSKADYSFTAQTDRIGTSPRQPSAWTHSHRGCASRRAGRPMAFRLALSSSPSWTRGILSISGGPRRELPASPGLQA
jgi:pimeloyl-ACP methyl ester carboxylesterase